MSFHTSIDSVRFTHGWAQLPSGRWVCRLPPTDADHPGLFAIVDYSTALELAARHRIRLIRPDTLIELNEHGFRIDPVTLPDAAQRMADPRRPGETAQAHLQRLLVNMSTFDWASRHAAAVMAELSATDWDHVLPVANVGKPWVEGALPGKSKLMGWSRSKTAHSLSPDAFGEWRQPLQNAHNRQHADYSSIPAFECDEEPTWIGQVVAATTAATAPTPPATALTATSFPESAVLKAISELGTRETSGNNDGVQIGKFFSGATRRGADGRERPTGWVPGWDWCAAFFGWCGGQGWRIAVHEYVTDAKAAGRFRALDAGYTPKRGDAVILSRGGHDPLKGGLGHICRVEIAPDAQKAFVTIGGNEENRVKRTQRNLTDADLRGFVEE